MAKCVVHLDIDAVARCETCGKDLCESCQQVYNKKIIRETGGVRRIVGYETHIFCPECLQQKKATQRKVALYGSIVAGVTLVGVLLYLNLR